MTPKITESLLRNIALEQGVSKRKAKQYAKHIVTAPWFPTVQETYTMPYALTYSDPTGEEAVHNVLFEALARTIEAERKAA